MAKYRKKPVVIDADQWFRGIQLDGVVCMTRIDSEEEATGSVYVERDKGEIVQLWNVPSELPLYYDDEHKHRHVQHPGWGWVMTKEGGIAITEGDYLITGIVGEKYPCKPDIFADSYDKISD
ncbi:hypothetical protein SP15_266 [Bacillus phage SP-15]|uniref:Uncharacterized protein n=1 Tax=Bacillus phage SP-15 TaxID=1792032 RepID=A0A127AWZ3_9CAUD|nr:hypothetical protein SP15_266 [Bacillus phage SP-15]AMM45073.1 hypothetical protein SP15_266 [Bacillus phage SP-15]